MQTIKLDPVTRLEGHMKIEVQVESTGTAYVVMNAKSTGNSFRGFENILLNRDPRDAVHITQRICGLCPVSHAVASVKAIESAQGFQPGLQSKFIRNIIQGADLLSSHILHFYHLSLMDYINGPDKPLWNSNSKSDLRFNKKASEELFTNYLRALEIRRRAHDICVTLGGKVPHVMSIMPGGVTKNPTAAEINSCLQSLAVVREFIENTYHQDVQKVASVYSDYFEVGKGYENLISFGAFDIEENRLLFRRARYTGGQYLDVDIHKITEDVTYAWYEDCAATTLLTGDCRPQIPKAGAYTWTKAPRYLGEPYETGPLARMWLNGDYRKGISVMDRHVARMLETKKIAHAMNHWLSGIQSGLNNYNTGLHNLTSGAGVGTTEAPRGALVHYVSYSNKLVNRYQIITPTCWNASPRDGADMPGPIERSLLGTEIKDISKPVELMRIVHSFDPCTACAVHIITPDRKVEQRFVINPN